MRAGEEGRVPWVSSARVPCGPGGSGCLRGVSFPGGLWTVSCLCPSLTRGPSWCASDSLSQDGFQRERSAGAGRTCSGLSASSLLGPPLHCGPPLCEHRPGVSGTTGSRRCGRSVLHPVQCLILVSAGDPSHSRSASTRHESHGGILPASRGGLGREQPTSQVGEWGSRDPQQLP